jgi:hypothetical protein
LIDGRLPWDLVVSPELRTAEMQTALRKLFAHVSVLPLAFNLADSLAESHCLRGSLVAACQAAISRSKPVRTGALVRSDGFDPSMRELRPDGSIRQEAAGFDYEAVNFAYDLWREESTRSYRRAAAFAGTHGVIYAGEDLTDDVVYILGKYREFAGRAPSALLRDVAGRARMAMWA